ncbi:unnamed protein product [Lepeophtheirus salmonis]|uniref:(salmon louse) hypothetical protein n=1 Tax=Lepeophtheirus salmonis TaxID=72036 RepID=A0A7R8H2Y5_LEPSM|nr:unnamed protein product [Lepeophtheirus salmonis]CAF2831958.1 unnamed protein product [Lepeophtheirus salmonis]
MEDSSNFPQLKSLLKLKKRYDAPNIKDLPETYKANSDKEKLYIWAAENFVTQIRHKFPVSLRLRRLIHLQWFLATQLGNSLEISCILVSFLCGFGFKAFVVTGFVDEETYNMDLQNKEYLSSSNEETETTNNKILSKVLINQANSKYKVPKPRVVESKYISFLQSLKEKSNQIRLNSKDYTGLSLFSWMGLCRKNIWGISWREKKTLGLNNEENWIPFISDLNAKNVKIESLPNESKDEAQLIRYKLISRETYPENDLVIERFGRRRKDQMKLHAYLRPFHTRTMEFYSEARLDKLLRRVSKAWELEESYDGREDAETSKSGRDIVKIIEKYEKPLNRKDRNELSSARILNQKDIYVRIFDFENNRIYIKFFHEKGQIFCKTAEFSIPGNPVADDLEEDDVKVFIVDPRDPKPLIYELRDLYNEQLQSQIKAINRVEVSESEINVLLEDRMKELSANELNVWIFDVKRNINVLKGRHEKSIQKKDKKGDGTQLYPH